MEGPVPSVVGKQGVVVRRLSLPSLLDDLNKLLRENTMLSLYHAFHIKLLSKSFCLPHGYGMWLRP